MSKPTQKKLEKRKRSRKARLTTFKGKKQLARARARKASEAAALMAGGAQVPDITDEEYVFWLCNGVNYLLSDAETGVWDPMFEGIYEGRQPEAEGVAQAVMARFADEIESPDDLSGIAQVVLAWTMTEKSNVRIYKYEAERRIQEKMRWPGNAEHNPADDGLDAEALARQPHNPTVWALMLEVRERSLERVVDGSEEVAAP